MNDDKALTVFSAPTMSLIEAQERRQALIEFTKSIMVKGVHYGIIPGTDKPTLLKPGAELLATFFGMAVRFEVAEKVTDWIGADHGDEPFFFYQYRTSLYRDGVLVAEGLGSCNSREKKYRWRWVSEESVPPHLNLDSLVKKAGKATEFEFAINAAKTSGKYSKPQEYWDRFTDAIVDGDAIPGTRETSRGMSPTWTIDSTVYRTPNEDIADQVNTIDKMAQKRSLIAAVLIAVNASEFYTQDIEDMDFGPIVEGEIVKDEPPKNTVAKKQPPPKQKKPSPKKSNGQKDIEHTILHSEANDFIDLMQKAINRYPTDKAVKGAMKKLGYDAVSRTPADRVVAYQHLSEYAELRNGGMDSNEAVDQVINKPE